MNAPFENATATLRVRPIMGLGSALAFCLAVLVSVDSARGQGLALEWFTVAGGGGVSSGGTYALSGTVGQPDTGRLAGGSYAMSSGFWGIVAEISPLLSVVQTAGAVTMYWPLSASGFVLERAATLSASPIVWSQVPFPYQTNATHIYLTVPAPTGNTFYRLRLPD